MTGRPWPGEGLVQAWVVQIWQGRAVKGYGDILVVGGWLILVVGDGICLCGVCDV